MKSTKVDFRQMSLVRCTCGKPIKQNMVDRKEIHSTLKCYFCYSVQESKRSHGIGKFGSPRSKRIAAGLPVK